MCTVLLVNGPNVNLLGAQEKGLYSKITWTDFEEQISSILLARKIQFMAYRPKSERELINWLYKWKRNRKKQKHRFISGYSRSYRIRKKLYKFLSISINYEEDRI